MTMTIDAVKAAAQFLSELRHTGRFGARIPEPNRPADAEDALRIQERIVRVQGVPIGGYKCSVPAEGRPIALAPIFAPTIDAKSPRSVRQAVPTAGDTARIEPEIAFVLGRDLPARAEGYTEAEVRAAIGETRCVLEILGSRYTDASQLPFVEVLADCISNQGLHIGPLVPGGLDAALEAFRIRIAPTAGGEPVAERDGKHPDGHPLRPLVWIADFLAKRGVGLSAGQIVTTGSYCGMVDVPLDTPLTVQFGTLGVIDVEFRRFEG